MRPFVLAGAALILLSSQAAAQQPRAQPPAKEKNKSTPSFNDDDLDRLAGRKPGEPRPSPSPVRAAPPPPPDAGGNGPSEEGGEATNGPSGEGDAGAEGPGSEGDWGNRAAGFRDTVATAEAALKSMEDRAQALLWEYLQSTDTNEIMRMKAEQQEILDQIPAAKQAVEDAQKALADFERTAAQAGVPRGELRGKKKP